MRFLAGVILAAALAAPASAQVDPVRRRLVQAGYDQSMSGAGPTSLYLFYYSNQPDFPHKGQTLRLALAPVYVDSELGLRGIGGGPTDLGLGLAGGGFAESYSEVREGHYFSEESFVGHGGSATASLYRRLNPGQLVPLSMIVRAGAHLAVYSKGAHTAEEFRLPPDHVDYRLRFGLRLGGEPPRLGNSRAAEFSIWYQGFLRDRSGSYGINDDRSLEAKTHLFWSKAAVTWRFQNGRRMQASLEAGSSRNADRLSVHRLGGLLPFAAEFPLSLPGYYNGELSAQRYALLGGMYSQPLTDSKRLSAHTFASVAKVDYLKGLDQPDPWNEGAGFGFDWDSPKKVWRLELNYAHGFNAIRSGGRGAHSASLLVQVDLHAWKRESAPDTEDHPRVRKPEGLDWLIEILKP